MSSRSFQAATARQEVFEMPEKVEYCAVCGEPTGKAGPGDGSIYCNCGAGPLCEKCWAGHWCAEKALEETKKEGA
jgi:hypothetical protein